MARILTKMWCGVDDAPEYRESGRRFSMLRAEVDGRRYMIPEEWVVGFCRSGATTADAVLHWHEQALIAERVA